MTAITNIEASRRVLEFAAEGRLVQRRWHKTEDGRELACLLGSIATGIDSPGKCPSSVMPDWLAHLTVTLFDGQTATDAVAWAKRFGAQMGQWHRINDAAWARIKVEFLVHVTTSALEAARPVASKESYWGAVESAHAKVVRALHGDGDMEAAANAAAYTAANAAAYTAANAAYTAANAAYTAANAAAYTAANAAANAANTAANAAANAANAAANAANAAAYTAANAAAYAANAAILCDLIDAELAKVGLRGAQVSDNINCNTPTPLVILSQGAVVVSFATVRHRSDRMALVDIDCSSKRARLIVGHCHSPTEGATNRFYFLTEDDSMHLHPTATGITEASLPEFDGWHVEIHDQVGRYCLSVLFVARWHRLNLAGAGCSASRRAALTASSASRSSPSTRLRLHATSNRHLRLPRSMWLG